MRAVGYAATAATLGLSLWMLWHFQTGRAGYQFVESERWMGSIGVKYVVGVDGISLFMIVLTALLFPIGLLASAKLTNRVKAFTAWMLLLEAALLGVFLGARPHRVLRVLRGRPRPDVLHHPRVGSRPA